MLSLKNSLAVLRKTNALLEGHFILSSGLHSPSYVQCAKLLSNPSKANKICLSLSKKIKKKIISQIKLNIPTYEKKKLPSNLKNIPITKPGSRYIK